MDPPLPPLPNINDSTVESVNTAAASSDLVSSPSTIVLSVVDDFFGSAFSNSGELYDEFLGKVSAVDDGNRTVNSGRNISESGQVGIFPDDGAEENEVLAFGVPFPAEQPFFENRITTKKKIMNMRDMIRKTISPTLPMLMEMILRHTTKSPLSKVMHQPQFQWVR